MNKVLLTICFVATLLALTGYTSMSFCGRHKTAVRKLTPVIIVDVITLSLFYAVVTFG